MRRGKASSQSHQIWKKEERSEEEEK